MIEKFYGYIYSPIGWFKIECSQEALLKIEFVEAKGESSPNFMVEKTISQLKEYFEGTRKIFELEIEFDGTEFQKKAWQALFDIPYGKTISYKEQATKINKPKAVRAIGGANNKNKIAIIVPCHRVVGQKGNLIGYAGGLDKKNWLLEHEKRFK